MRSRTSTTLEQKWWFIVSAAALSAVFTNLVLRMAGLGSPENLAQFIVYLLCFMGIWKCIAFLSWLLVLVLKPSSKLLDPVTR
jgi:hypothetical protein